MRCHPHHQSPQWHWHIWTGILFMMSPSHQWCPLPRVNPCEGLMGMESPRGTFWGQSWHSPFSHSLPFTSASFLLSVSLWTDRSCFGNLFAFKGIFLFEDRAKWRMCQSVGLILYHRNVNTDCLMKSIRCCLWDCLWLLEFSFLAWISNYHWQTRVGCGG